MLTTSLERRLAAELADLLGVDTRPGTLADLPSGDRLRMAAHLSLELGTDVLPSDVGRARNLRELVSTAIAATTAAPADTAAFPLSRAQSRFMLAELVVPGTPDNSVLQAYWLDGVIETAAWRAAVADLVGRHAGLRTVCRSGAGGLTQLISPEPGLSDLLEIVEPGPAVPEGGAEAVAAAACASWWAEPIDPMSSIPFRARLYRYGDTSGLLLLNFHHVAVDGQSLSIIWGDLVACYRARLAGARASLPKALGYRHYVDWERVQLPRWRARELPYWREVLGRRRRTGTGLATSVETLGERRECTLTLDPATLARVVDGSRHRGRTLLCALTHAAGRALSHILDIDQLTFGTIASGRFDREFWSTVGCFINPVVLRLAFRGGRNREETLADTADAILGALRHCRTPFDELVRALGGFRAIGGVDAWVVLQERTASGEIGDRLRYTEVHVPAPATVFGLIFEAVRTQDGLVLRLQWREPGVTQDVGARIVERWRSELVSD